MNGDHHHEHAHAARSDLTRNQSLVFDTLEGADAPLTAYNILDRLNGEGLRAPLQVYRALDKLLDLGMVHRLESLNAFVACRHPGCATHEAVAFAICDDCGSVAEITDSSLVDALDTITRSADFKPRKTTVEMRGLCSDCQAA
ncbi:Fur family transcriptional regulator [Oricola sp.]|uniref:Fur family transcriptional regulator n=1 Tax=Oricola sp. TaxID=1979950 RepID=UPI000C9529C9|nr:transcriptional repressor [Ahrensia sp.]|tara:strand:- start:12366 stop:12794 length:429 start_codon:yes stop_codon:yes gene_type:complete